jgi:hypothetical protein
MHEQINKEINNFSKKTDEVTPVSMHHAMSNMGKAKAKLLLFSTSTLDGDEWSVSRTEYRQF